MANQSAAIGASGVLARRAAFVCVRTIVRALVHGKGKYLGSTPVPAQRRARPSYEAVT